MGYRTPGTSKLSLGVDTSAESLKSDVKKNIQSEVDKARHARLTKLAGGYTDVDVIPEERTKETKEKYAEQMKKVATDTRQNQAMLQTTKDLDAGALKNIKRGTYVGENEGRLYFDRSGEGFTDAGERGPTTDYLGRQFNTAAKYQAPVSGTSTTQKGMKGSSEVYTFEQDMPDKVAGKDEYTGYNPTTGETFIHKKETPVETPKSKKEIRQTKRKERKEARYQKQSQKFMDKYMSDPKNAADYKKAIT